VKRGWISADEGTVLKDLWENRNNLHPHLLPGSEHNIHKVEYINATQAALLRLMDKLKALHDRGTLIAELAKEL
jgi:hypothetical protein